jgi:carotenoid 1,2-hydratase
MRFDQAVKPGGYQWWYVDAVSDDGEHAITLIAFIGSVFSPYYAWANAKAAAPAENYCAMNVALYGRHKAWAMTERGSRFLLRRKSVVRIGPSLLRWENGILHAEVDEVTAPVPGKLRGRFEVKTGVLQERVFVLDAEGRHRWRPVAPAARIEVAFEHPKMSWRGKAYFDTNDGDVPLERDFLSWHWSRSVGEGEAEVFYDVVRKDSSAFGLALKIGEDGVAREVVAPALRDLPRGFWGVKRAVRAAGEARVLRTLEDAPFYLRSHVVVGDGREAMCESLDLTRFSKRIVKLMLPFRMPRVR